MSELLLGIDGGGSKTRLCIAGRDGTIIHVAQAGGSNPHDNPDWRRAFETLRAGIAPHWPSIRAAGIGVGSYRESAAIDREVDVFLHELFPLPGLDIENDVYLARDAAFPGEPGMLLIAGTGSMLVGRRDDGSTFRIGGWGTPIGDEGSAYWIGREALSLATRMQDGRIPATDYAEALFAALLENAHPAPGQIFDWLAGLSHQRSAIAAISRHVETMARAGQAEATALLATAADHLAEHVTAGRRLAGEAAAWSLLGGLGNSSTIRALLASRLGPMAEPAMPPCGGALWRAAQRLGWSVDGDWIARISTGLATGESQALPVDTKDLP